MKLEDKIRNSSEEIFGCGSDLPAGHRERFSARLAASKKTGTAKSIRTIPLWSKVRYIVAAAAVFAGLAFMLNLFFKTDDAEDNEPDAEDVRNYYAMKLDEEVDATKRLAQNVDAEYRKELLKNIEMIQKAPLPDVQMTDDEHIALIANVYNTKIETLQQIQETITEIN